MKVIPIQRNYVLQDNSLSNILLKKLPNTVAFFYALFLLKLNISKTYNGLAIDVFCNVIYSLISKL